MSTVLVATDEIADVFARGPVAAVADLFVDVRLEFIR
jgi:hypothetical protein